MRLITFAGGDTPIEGGFAYFNPVEIHEAKVRIANTTFEDNADGQSTPTPPAPARVPPGFAPATRRAGPAGVAGGPGGLAVRPAATGAGWTARNGRGDNGATVIYAIGAQPVDRPERVPEQCRRGDLDQRQFAEFGGPAGSAAAAPDWPSAFTQFADNHGPLVRLNRLDENAINGMEIGAELLTVEGVWDDTDIVHVVQGEIRLPENYHTYSGLRLESSDKESLVVKLRGGNAGFTVNGKPLDIEDRIGSSMQVLGTPGHPVVMTSVYDCTVAAGYTPDGLPQSETLNGFGCGAVTTTVPYADVIVVIDESGSMQLPAGFHGDHDPAIGSGVARRGRRGRPVRRQPVRSWSALAEARRADRMNAGHSHLSGRPVVGHRDGIRRRRPQGLVTQRWLCRRLCRARLRAGQLRVSVRTPPSSSFW